MSDDVSNEESSRSLDQRAVDEYLASERFEDRQSLPSDLDWRNQVPVMSNPWTESGYPSLISGLVGLSALTLFFAVLLPIGIEMMQDIVSGRPSYPVMMMFVQTLFLPPIICYAFTVVTPVFWYGSIFLRFLMATVVALPGIIGFYAAMSMLEGPPPNDFWLGYGLVMGSAFLAAAIVSVTVQMWSRFSLSHYRPDDAGIPPLGTRAIFELTGIAAIGFAIFVTLDTAEYMEGIMFFAGIGLFSSIAIISALIAYFQAGRKRVIPIVIGGAFIFAGAFLVNGFFAVMEYGWDVLSVEVFLIGAISLYGAAISLGVMWLCLRWLRFCNWRCVNQKHVRGVQSDMIAASPSGPWANEPASPPGASAAANAEPDSAPLAGSATDEPNAEFRDADQAESDSKSGSGSESVDSPLI